MERRLDTVLRSFGNPGIESGMASPTRSPTTQESDQLIFSSLGLEDINNVQWENYIASGSPPANPSIHPQVSSTIPLTSNNTNFILPHSLVHGPSQFPQFVYPPEPYFGANPFEAASSNVPYSPPYRGHYRRYRDSTHPSFLPG